MLAIPLIFFTSTHLGTVVALRPHVLHFPLLVLPVKISVLDYGLNILVNPNFVNKRNTFLIDIKTLKHSFVIAGHLYWLSAKLPEMYVTGWTMEFR